MITRLVVAVALASIHILTTTFPSLAADACATTANGAADYVGVEVHCERTPSQASTIQAAPTPYTDYRWQSAIPACYQLTCFDFEIPCEDPSTFQTLWGLHRDYQEWTPIRTTCRTSDVERSPITDAMVLRALRRIGLPALPLHTNPSTETLVNLPTVFYTDPRPVSHILILLGQRVEVEATPSAYTWHFGDDGTLTTRFPGRPYPSLDVTHNYLRSGRAHPRLDTSYTARYRTNGGPWRTIVSTVTVAGTPQTLRVVEATPVLSGIR